MRHQPRNWRKKLIVIVFHIGFRVGAAVHLHAHFSYSRCCFDASTLILLLLLLSWPVMIRMTFYPLDVITDVLVVLTSWWRHRWGRWLLFKAPSRLSKELDAEDSAVWIESWAFTQIMFDSFRHWVAPEAVWIRWWRSAGSTCVSCGAVWERPLCHRSTKPYDSFSERDEQRSSGSVIVFSKHPSFNP